MGIWNSISGLTEQADDAIAAGDYVDVLDVSANSGNGKRVKKTVQKFVAEALGLAPGAKSLYLAVQGSDPAAPTSGVRLYCKLNGGKHTLYMRAPTGAAVVVTGAVEP